MELSDKCKEIMSDQTVSDDGNVPDCGFAETSMSSNVDHVLQTSVNDALYGEGDGTSEFAVEITKILEKKTKKNE